MSLDIGDATGITMIGIIFIAVAGNLMTLFVITRYPPLRDVTGMFLANLAVADLLQAVIGMPLIATSAFRKEWVFGNVLCVISGMTNSLFCITSVLTLTAVSIDRYLAIVHPLHYQNWLTVNRAKMALVYLWTQASFAALLPVFGWSRYVYLPYEFICTVQWEYDRAFTITVWSTCFIAPVLVTVVCYSGIGKVASKRAREERLNTVGSVVNSQEMCQAGALPGYGETNSIRGKENLAFMGAHKDIGDKLEPKRHEVSTTKCIKYDENLTPDSVSVRKDDLQAQGTPPFELAGKSFNPKEWLSLPYVLGSSLGNPAIVLSFPDAAATNNNFDESCVDKNGSCTMPSIVKGMMAQRASEAKVAFLRKVRKPRVGPADAVSPAISGTPIAKTNARKLELGASLEGQESVHHTRKSIKLQGYLARVRESKAERRVGARCYRRKEMKMALILLIVNGTFVLCWLPHFVGSLCLTFAGGSCPFPDSFFIITTTLAMLNSGCNPFIYTLTYRKFRQAFKRVMPFLRSKRRPECKGLPPY